MQHSHPVFCGSRLDQPFEHAAEIGRITKAASDGDIFQFEIVIAQQEFAAGNADVGQIINERHVPVPMKHP
jgi:hypothetical protein